MFEAIKKRAAKWLLGSSSGLVAFEHALESFDAEKRAELLKQLAAKLVSSVEGIESTVGALDGVEGPHAHMLRIELTDWLLGDSNVGAVLQRATCTSRVQLQRETAEWLLGSIIGEKKVIKALELVKEASLMDTVAFAKRGHVYRGIREVTENKLSTGALNLATELAYACNVSFAVENK